MNSVTNIQFNTLVKKVLATLSLTFICVITLFLGLQTGVQSTYAATSDIFTPKCTPEGCPFTFLAPIGFGGFGSGGVLDVAKDGATTYLKGLYAFGIAIAAALAVLMITLGGVQYSTTDAIGGKSEGKEKIKSALIGLLLALLSYTILNTINPYLVAGDFVPPPISTDGSIGNKAPEGTPAVVPAGAGGAVGTPGATGTTGSGGVVDGTAAQRLDQSAQNMMGKDTCYVSNTASGRRACAYVVNAIVDEALGTPINGVSGNTNSYGRATAEMYKTLSTSNRFMLVGSDISQLKPGDIIISPTVGEKTGHVGIYASTGKIVSNSSSATEVDDKFSPTSWQNYYTTTRGLGTYIFRARVSGN